MHDDRGCLFLRRLVNGRSGCIAKTLSPPAGAVEQTVQTHGPAFGAGRSAQAAAWQLLLELKTACITARLQFRNRLAP